MGCGLYAEQCCIKNQPMFEVQYVDPRYNQGKPIAVCEEHWNQEDENGLKFWQIKIRTIKQLAVVS